MKNKTMKWKKNPNKARVSDINWIENPLDGAIGNISKSYKRAENIKKYFQVSIFKVSVDLT